jgi:hypothetical protein
MTPETAHRGPDKPLLGNVPPAASSTKHGAASARPGKTRWPKRRPHTSCDRVTITLRRQLGKARSLICQRLPFEGEGPVNQLHLHSRYSTPGIDRKLDEDRRGQMPEPPSTRRIRRSRQHKQARAKDRIDRSYLAEELWKRLETAPERHRTTAAITWRSTPITMHE